MSLTLQLWEHQKIALSFALQKENAYLAMHMGTGKTLTTLAYIDTKQIKKSIVICPKKVIPVWESYNGKISNHTIAVLSGDTSEKSKTFTRYMMSPDNYILCVNYESFWRLPLINEIAKYVQNGTIGLIVLDEAHRIKGIQSKSSTALVNKCLKPTCKKLLLSGTPYRESPLDIWMQYRFLDPTLFPSYTAFRNKYAVVYDLKKEVRTSTGKVRKIVVPIIKSFRNLEDLGDKLSNKMIIIKKEDTKNTQPPVTDSTVFFDLDSMTRDAYTRILKYDRTLIGGSEVTTMNALTKKLRLQQVTSGYITTDDDKDLKLGDDKISCLLDTIQDLPPNEPIVIFYRFTNDRDSIRSAITETYNETISCVCGEINQLQDWVNGSTRILAVQVQAGSEGIDLTRACYAVFYSVSYSAGQYDQACSRLDRPGQTRPVTLIHIVANKTVEVEIYKSLFSKTLTTQSLDEIIQTASEHAKGEM
jgi:SNF2 family DNA or RNA helicase